MRIATSVLLAIAALIAATSSNAASCWQGVQQQLMTPQGVNSVTPAPMDEAARKCLSELLTDPDTLNRALAKVTASSSSGALLRDLHLEFKTFEAPDASGANQAHLGLAYRYDKSIVTSPVGQACGDACLNALDLRFSAQGNVALQSDVNPRDFLESRLTIAWFRSSGGATRLDDASREQLETLTEQAVQIPASRASELPPLQKQISRLLADHLTNQVAIEFGADVSLESDQRFRAKHWVYAAHAALDFRGWSGMDATSWQATSTAAKFNVFDYPFALLRRLTGYGECDAAGHGIGECFVPRGTSWPTVYVAIGQVQPSSGDPRAALVGTGSYTRVATEVSFKTPIAKWQNNPVYVSANWRLYDELNAPAAVRAADLAHFNYLVATVGPQRGLFASYSTGRLPFDRRDDQVYELGFRAVLD